MALGGREWILRVLVCFDLGGWVGGCVDKKNLCSHFTLFFPSFCVSWDHSGMGSKVDLPLQL